MIDLAFALLTFFAFALAYMRMHVIPQCAVVRSLYCQVWGNWHPETVEAELAVSYAWMSYYAVWTIAVGTVAWLGWMIA